MTITRDRKSFCVTISIYRRAMSSTLTVCGSMLMFGLLARFLLIQPISDSPEQTCPIGSSLSRLPEAVSGCLEQPVYRSKRHCVEDATEMCRLEEIYIVIPPHAAAYASY